MGGQNLQNKYKHYGLRVIGVAGMCICLSLSIDGNGAHHCIWPSGQAGTIGWPLGHFFVFVLLDLCKLQVTVCANFMNVDMDLNVKNQWIPLEQNQ